MSAQQQSMASTREPSSLNLTVPQDRVITIEHPCIIRDIDRGIATLGGEYQIKQALEGPPEVGPAPQLATSLRAGDPLARKLLSNQGHVNHLLLRVSLPKLTGRKRERGTNDPFAFHDGRPNDDHDGASNKGSEAAAPAVEKVAVNEENSNDSAMPLTADQVLQKLAANKHDLAAEVVGTIHTSHRFRSLPDFQLLDSDNHVMQQVTKHLLNPTLDNIASFSSSIDMNSREPPSTILGPPSFVHYSQQLYYGYAQARGTSIQTDASGRSVSVNTRLPQRRIRLGVPGDAPDLPSSPPTSVPELSTADSVMQELVARLGALLAERPIVTRRAAQNLISPLPTGTTDAHLALSMQYVGYMFRSGPWKDTLVRFGVDPRLDPKYRSYQTLTFQLTPRDRAASSVQPRRWMRDTTGAGAFPGAATLLEKDSHLFTGEGLLGTKTWQVCDVQEPLLKGIIDNAAFKEEPETTGAAGYFQAPIVALLRVIMRDKIAELMAGNPGDRWDSVYGRLIDAVVADVEPGLWTADWGLLSTKERKKGMELLQGVKSMMSVAASARKVGQDGDDDEDGDAMRDLEALDRNDLGDSDEEGE